MTSPEVALQHFQNLRAVKISQDWSADWFRESNEEEMKPFSAYPFGRHTFKAVTNVLAASSIGIESLTLGQFDKDSLYTWVPSQHDTGP